jgi:hypothetical protein
MKPALRQARVKVLEDTTRYLLGATPRYLLEGWEPLDEIVELLPLCVISKQLGIALVNSTELPGVQGTITAVHKVLMRRYSGQVIKVSCEDLNVPNVWKALRNFQHFIPALNASFKRRW